MERHPTFVAALPGIAGFAVATLFVVIGHLIGL